MLLPDKHLDLNNSVLRISTEILKRLKKHKAIKYDALYTELLNHFKESTINYLYIYCLDFLFLANLITYNKSKDLIELHENI